MILLCCFYVTAILSFSGYEVVVKKIGSENWLDFFIPEADIYSPQGFKAWLDMAHIMDRWKVQCSAKPWSEMIEKRLG